MKLFIGPRNRVLGEHISQQTGIAIASWELVRFGDSEVKPVIKENVRGEDVVVVHSTSNPVNEAYMELFLLVDVLRRSACKRIILAIPYYGYARQNQQHLPGEPVSAQVVARIIESVGVDELITVDLHEEQLTGFFTIPVTHVSGLPLLAKQIGDFVAARSWRASEGADQSQAGQGPAATVSEAMRVIVISPDQGGVERTRKFRDALAQAGQGPATTNFSVDEEIGIVEKLRNLESVHETKFVEITGNISGKIAIIPDDVIVSGGTILHAAEEALNRGAVKVFLAASHADFIEGAAEKLQNSRVEHVFVTDTIELSDSQKFQKLQVVSVGGLLAQEIKKLV
jgi:ribose-phosphate pyrophosphokinase